eukprot:g31599.t1
MSSVDAAARNLEEVLRLHFGGNEALGLPSSVPVAPALRCTILLTSLFFSVFLAVISLRMSRVFLGPDRGHSLEARLAKATEALSVVPVVAILMILGRSSHAWLSTNPKAHLCMYGATLACFFRFLTAVCSFRSESEEALATAQGIRSTATAMLFVCCAAIAVSTLVMEAKSGDNEPLGTMMQCMLALTVAYFTETGVREVFAKDPAPSYGSFSPTSQEEDLLALPARVSLQFPPMLCVLFVAIALRAVQLHLEPRFWAVCATYLTTLATVLQQLRSTMLFMKEGKGSLLGDEAAGPAFCPTDSDQKSKIFWSVTTCCIYAGTTLILLSVASMESKASAAASAPAPLSTAMCCVMALTVVYFLTYLLVMAGSLLRQFFGTWAQSTATGVQRALAFAPMLCVMMIGVRLRAMQIGVRDPPYWAQVCMVVATGAVITQVSCTILTESESGAGMVDKDAATKLMLLLLLGLRYAASAVLFVSVASLMISLAWMQPVLDPPSTVTPWRTAGGCSSTILKETLRRMFKTVLFIFLQVVVSRRFSVPLSRQVVPVKVNGQTVSQKTAYYGSLEAEGGPIVESGTRDRRISPWSSIQVPAISFFRTSPARIACAPPTPAMTVSSRPGSPSASSRRGVAPAGRPRQASAVEINGDGSPTKQEHDLVSISYGIGEVVGDFVRDVVCIGEVSEPHCASARVVLAQRMTPEPFQQFDFDGVLGLGLQGLALNPEFHFFSQLASSIEPSFGVFLARPGSSGSSVTFGGHDAQRMQRPLAWVPVSLKEQGYWAASGLSSSYDCNGMAQDGTCHAIVDTGTSLLGVPRQAMASLLAATAQKVEAMEDCGSLVGPALTFELESGASVTLESQDYWRPAPPGGPSIQPTAAPQSTAPEPQPTAQPAAA